MTDHKKKFNQEGNFNCPKKNTQVQCSVLHLIEMFISDKEKITDDKIKSVLADVKIDLDCQTCPAAKFFQEKFTGRQIETEKKETEQSTCHNANRTCWNCPSAKLKGNVDFRACGQNKKIINTQNDEQIMIECSRRPELGRFEPTITFEQCPEWQETNYGYFLKKMRVMILGIDGYLGWTLALKLGKLGCKVSGVDNYLRRKCLAERDAHSIVPIASMSERIKTAKEQLGMDIEFKEMDIKNHDGIKAFIEEHQPEAIVHYAEIPSAPYSMIDVHHAIEVQNNNVIGTMALLWAIKDAAPNASLIKLGTMGEYGTPLSGRPIFEGMFPSDAIIKWKGREWSLGGELTPRDPGSYYHVSKVQDTFNVHAACKYWWLRSYDVMQGVIYGVHTDELASNPKLRTRLDIDEWFGTVVNRFVAQTILGIPLTIYGEGQQIRGFIALDDAMDCMVRLIASPPEQGQYEVVNQVSGLYKIFDIAETVANVAKEKFGLSCNIQRIENPRVEAASHPLEVDSLKLPSLGFNPNVSLSEEIEKMFTVMTDPEIKQRILEKSNSIIPKTQWSGENKQGNTLETYQPGTKEKSGYEGVLHQSQS